MPRASGAPWADYFGRPISARSAASLSAQVLAQAAGPLLSGAPCDCSGGYQFALECLGRASSSRCSRASIASPRPERGDKRLVETARPISRHMMRWKLVDRGPPATYAIVLATGDETIGALQQFVRERKCG
jgi:hypothetical protein